MLQDFKKNNKFLMLALDHRESFKQFAETSKKEKLIFYKTKILQALNNLPSGILVDPGYGLPAYQSLDLEVNYLLPIEKSGFDIVNGSERVNKLQYQVNELKRLGAKGIKLQLQVHPFISVIDRQVQLASKVLKDCRTNELPLFLEVLVYQSGEKYKKRVLIIEALKKLMQAGVQPDVFKLQYPGNAKACLAVTNLLGEIPWILLSGGKEFSVIKGELEEAVNYGAQGFLIGRALWQDFFKVEDKQKFLKDILPTRFQELIDTIC